MKKTRYRCVVCGKLTAGRLPRTSRPEVGDGTLRYPRQHKGPDGLLCPGSFMYAEWVDVEVKRSNETEVSR